MISSSGKPKEIFLHQNFSGKFKSIREIIELKKQGFIYIATVLFQNNTVKVIVNSGDLANIKLGDKVVVASKAFNPVLNKLP